MLHQDRNHQWVYSFEEGNASMKTLLGGKGANVAEMRDIGLPVPPGFVVSTEACTAYQAYQRQFPEGMWSQVQANLAEVEAQTGKVFGSAENLVSSVVLALEAQHIPIRNFRTVQPDLEDVFIALTGKALRE